MRYKRVIPWFLFLASVFILYYTSYPSIGWWDSGIYASNAYNLSIPDPGGSILFVLLGKLFITIFFFLPPVEAATLVSIFSTSGAVVFIYYTLLFIFDNLPVKAESYLKIFASAVTALSLPFLYSIWQESYVTRIYALGLLLTSILIFCSIKIWMINDQTEKRRLAFIVMFILGIDFTAHRLNTPFIPVFIILLLYPLRKELKSIKFWAVIVGTYLLGFSLHLFLLIRSSAHPSFAMDDIQNIQ